MEPKHFEMSPEAVAAQLNVDPAHGLSAPQIRERAAQYGLNRLPEAPPRSPFRVFLAQFKSILILILLAAAVLAASIGNVKDAIVILTVVVINALFGFFQEYRAERSLAALKAMLPAMTRVRRNGQEQKLPAEQLVPGDLVLLEAGDFIPADGRLALAAALEVDESALTGESQPVGKESGVLIPPDAPLAERTNMLYMNTMLTRGRAEMLVTATGMQTEIGALSQSLATAKTSATPLQIQLDQLGKRLGVLALVLVGILSLLALMRGKEVTHIILDAIALAVAAMPEGLPVVVTVTLALGMQNMARQRAIVKHLASVETLGCTTVICSDKTGTLTVNQMTVREFYYQGRNLNVTGEGYRASGDITSADDKSGVPDLGPLIWPMVACNDSKIEQGKVIGDPMEAALLVLAQKSGADLATVLREFPRLAEVPFDSAHKFMATFHRKDGRVHVFVKGAPDVLLARCSHRLCNGEILPVDEVERQRINTRYGELGGKGLRGLMIASRTLDDNEFEPAGDLHRWVENLTFVGLLGLMDPPRAEAKLAIAQCKQAGIAVKMITGDHQHTAMAIAAELGLQGGTISGAELDQLDGEALASTIEKVAVFARVTPAHKVKIVRALQEKGHVVAMTGDGVNDAPALKTADIGVAMGTTGTAVAKEAATMVLLDDNFATMVNAVHQGRALYDNILKFVRFQLSTTVGAILTVFFAPLFGLPEPFTPLQILWVAIIMDGPPAVSLALDAARPGIMSDPPRGRHEPVLPLSRVMKIVSYGVIMMVGTLGVLYYGIQSGMEQTQATTLAITTFVLFQFFNLFNARVEQGTAFNRHLFDNGMLWASLAGVVLLQIIAVHWPPAQSIFATSALGLEEWALAIGVASCVLVLEELRKLMVTPFGSHGARTSA